MERKHACFGNEHIKQAMPKPTPQLVSDKSKDCLRKWSIEFLITVFTKEMHK